MRKLTLPLSYRQGDVTLVPVTAIPESARPVARDRGRLVLRYGEVTGHAHVIDAPEAEAVLLTTDEGERFLRLVHGAPLRHEEHGTIELPPGLYRLPPQHEWSDADEPLAVLD